jgi:phenylacetate-coenzyme A ligase PaaK-like adenylate-forming protein
MTYINLAELEKLAEESQVRPTFDAMISSDVNDIERWRRRRAWDTVMLAQTLQHAMTNVSYYAAAWQDAGVSVDDFNVLDDLRAFPIVRKQDVVREKDSFICRGSMPTSTRDTSGTTGERLSLYGSDAESRAISALVRVRSAHLSGRTQVMLRVLPPLHRMSDTRYTPTTDRIFSLPVTLHTLGTISWFDSLDHLLERMFAWYSFEHEKAQPSMIHITPPPLLGIVSEELKRRGVRLSESPIKDIALSGGIVPPYVRRWVEQEWSARCHSIYTCTEVLGDAIECRNRSDVYHVGPSMWAEVIDPVTFEAVEHGEHGMLLLTSYYPFQIVMPMIRYWTGDIVELCDNACSCGDLGLAFRFVARQGHAVNLSDYAGRRYFLGTTKVEVACDGVPQIPKFPFPRFRVDREEIDNLSRLSLQIETIQPSSFNTNEVMRTIRDRLEAECGMLGPAIKTGRLTLNVSLHGKGSLKGYFKLYPDR